MSRRAILVAQLLVLGGCLSGALNVVLAAETFPYTAYINSDGVYIRSGPGQNYYPASKLGLGAAVTVYRHDPGGWYAIRPPEGSFSWIAAEFLEPDEGNIATVIGDRVVARVGSMLSDVRDVIQVRLERGEQVEVYEAQRVGTGPAARTWYKVAPPAGEFRWIYGQFLDESPPTPKPRDASPANNLLIARMLDSETAEESEVQGPTDEGGQSLSTRDVVSYADDPRERAIERPIDSRQEPADSRLSSRFSDGPRSEPRQREERLADDSNSDWREPRQREESRLPVAATSGDLATQLANLELELAQMVTHPPEQWRLEPLLVECDAALRTADGPLERGHVRLLLRRVERFADIQREYAESSGPDFDSAPIADEPGLLFADRSAADRPTADRAIVERLATDDRETDGPSYDGTGRLAQVVARGNDTPRYILLDKFGKPRCYISPAAGVNLQPFVGREVGVQGTLGYLPEHAAQHVTVRQIVPLQGRLFR